MGYRHDHMEVSLLMLLPGKFGFENFDLLLCYQVLSPFKDGIVAGWDIVDGIWDHALRELLFVLVCVLN